MGTGKHLQTRYATLLQALPDNIRDCLKVCKWSAGDIVQLLHIVPHSHFTSVIQQSEQQEEMLVRFDLFRPLLFRIFSLQTGMLLD